METNSYIPKLKNIIERIFHSLDTIHPSNIEVEYIGEEHFDTDEIDQYCFQFEKMNSQFLKFELLIPTKNPLPHNIDLTTFANQVVYKYNIENIANYISIFESTNIQRSCHFEKKYIFKIMCTLDNKELNIVYVNIDPNNFFE
jgi:hypothetical protein